MKLSAAKGEGAATVEEIAEFSEGLVCLAGAEGGPALDKAFLVFGKHHVYAELQRHLSREEEVRNQATVELARRLRLPLLATNGVRHAQLQQREVFDVLTCVRHKTTIAEAGRILARNSERHLKSPAEMAHLFRDLPEAIANTGELAARLDFTLADLGYRFPDYPVPPGETMASFLRKRTDEGRAQPLPSVSRTRPPADRARTQADREAASSKATS